MSLKNELLVSILLAVMNFSCLEYPNSPSDDGGETISPNEERAVEKALAMNGGSVSGKTAFLNDGENGSYYVVWVEEGGDEVEYRISADSGDILYMEKHDSVFDTTMSSSYPGFLLNVPFLPQVPPPDSATQTDWSKTKNCGQTSVLMTMAFLNRFTPSSQQIVNEDSWLATKYNNTSFKAPYSTFTNTDQLKTLTSEYWQYQQTMSGKCSGSAGCKNFLYNSIMQSKPVVVAVRLNMSSSTSTAGHFMVLIGMNDTTVVVNDPGHTKGGGIQYSYSQFDASWATQGRAYVVYTNMSQ